MSTRHDYNFVSLDGDQVDISDQVYDPIGQGWERGRWQDTLKLHRRRGRQYRNIKILDGGTEDTVDMTLSVGNILDRFSVAAGDKYVLTLKGQSNGNLFSNWAIVRPARVCDVQIGDWYSYGTGPSEDNVFRRWYRTDGKPVTYAYRWGCRPKWEHTKTRHLWWRSVGLTVHYAAKYVWHIWLKQPDK